MSKQIKIIKEKKPTYTKRKNNDRILSLSVHFVDKYLATKQELEQSFPAQITLKDSQFIELLLNFYLQNNKQNKGK
tara:strand:+ start:102 stop:329 length:228 start_codon:yes stop_codon:yes gene_type:complete